MKLLFCLSASLVLVALVWSANSANIADEKERELGAAGQLEQVDAAENVPDALDWRNVPGRVSPVKDMDIEKCPQGYWAFAVTGVLEGQQVKENVILEGEQVIPLSEQQLLDCTKDTRGCMGGWADYTLKDLARLGGIESSQTYPYNPTHPHNSECQYKSTSKVMTVEGYKDLRTFKDEDGLRKAVATYGPVIVMVYKTEHFDNYKSGVFVDDSCPERRANTPFLLVGYGTDPKEGDYWILKTPFGTNWGESGYIRFARNRNNMCSITNFATVATF